MAQNNTQKVIRNIIRLCKEKNYIIEFRGVRYNRHIAATNNYEQVREVYKNFSSGTIVIYEDDDNLHNPMYFYYNIHRNEINTGYESLHNTPSLSFLKEAQFLSDIGY